MHYTVGLLTSAEPDDSRAGSGTIWHMARALERAGHTVQHFGPVRPFWLPALLAAGAVSRRIAPRHQYNPWHGRMLARAYGRAFTAKARGSKVDWFLAPFGGGALAFFEDARPVVYASDATFHAMLDYYPGFDGLSRQTLRSGEEIERRALARADVACFASEWAADSAVRDYAASAGNVHVIPFGQNFDTLPSRPLVRERAPDAPLRLLFVGVDWERKGGAIAFDTVIQLRAMGIAAHLTIVGCVPPAEFRDASVDVIPFLDKRQPADAARLSNLFAESDLLVLPTRAECYGLVFVEAAALGLPSIATRTGGVPTAVADGETGILLPPSAAGGAYAEEIAALMADTGRYRAMREAARRRFEDSQNWDAWTRRVTQLVTQLPSR